MKSKTIIYVDAFNLYYGAVKGTPYRWLNLHELFSRLFPRNDVVAIRYFTARVRPIPSDPDQPLRQQLYFRALGTLPKVQIIEGHYLLKSKRLPLKHPPASGSHFAEVLVSEEKGSDVNLASYLLLDAFKGRFDCAVVVSGDSDLAMPITMVREEFSKTVGVLLPQIITGPYKKTAPRRAAKLKASATFFREGMREGVLKASQFPPELSDANGVFCKPASW